MRMLLRRAAFKPLSLCLFGQLTAAGASGASGRCAARTARGSAAGSARRRSPNTEGGCVTGWRWPRTTAPAACARRVSPIITTTSTTSTTSPPVHRERENRQFNIISVSPTVCRDCAIIDLLFIIFWQCGLDHDRHYNHAHYQRPHSSSLLIQCTPRTEHRECAQAWMHTHMHTHQ